jgi:uncharacterized protein (DUF2132 family)
MSYNENELLPFDSEEYENVKFIEHTTEWMLKFLNDFNLHKRAKTFPENLYAAQNLSMVEDMATQIAVKAAEMQETRNKKQKE